MSLKPDFEMPEGLWNGEVAYELWAKFMLSDHNVDCDKWDELDDADKSAWNKLAEYTAP